MLWGHLLPKNISVCFGGTCSRTPFRSKSISLFGLRAPYRILMTFFGFGCHLLGFFSNKRIVCEETSQLYICVCICACVCVCLKVSRHQIPSRVPLPLPPPAASPAPLPTIWPRPNALGAAAAAGAARPAAAAEGRLPVPSGPGRPRAGFPRRTGKRRHAGTHTSGTH